MVRVDEPSVEHSLWLILEQTGASIFSSTQLILESRRLGVVGVIALGARSKLVVSWDDQLS
jgi:hypothetical protein